jgi:hypothetical protein
MTIHKVRRLAILGVAVAGILSPATAVDAQQRSRYSYDEPPQYSAKGVQATHAVRHAPPRQSQRALIEELRRRSYAKRKNSSHVTAVRERSAMAEHRRTVAESSRVIERRRVVYDPPRVIEHRRIVDDPPRVVERYHLAEDCSVKRGLLNSIFWSWSGGYCR